MPNRTIRNNLRHYKRAPRKVAAPHAPSSVGWLPSPNADYVAWAQAAERARQEFDAVWQRYRLRTGGENLSVELENARQLWLYTMARAYPAGFWEGLAGLHAGEVDNLEIYIAFLEADLHFFRSGYAKSEVIRGLKRLRLTPKQQNRLQQVVLRVVDKGFRREFRDYCRLARHVQSDDWLRDVETRLASHDPNHALRAQWVLDACQRK